MVKLERQRYILFKIIKDVNLFCEKKDFLNLIWRYLCIYFGMKEANKIGLWLFKLNLEEEIGIIRCSNKTKEVIISALTLIREINGKRIIISPVKTSGTIKGLNKVKIK